MTNEGLAGRPARRRFYLDTVSAQEALERLSTALEESAWFSARETETISSYDSQQRVTAQAVYANASSPHYPASAMDGVAVRSSDLSAASERNPVRLSLGGQALVVDTGDPIPPGLDAVVMWEDLTQVSAEEVTVVRSVAPWQHVRMVGEDIVQNEMLLPGLYRIGPPDIGALLAAGVLTVDVIVPPVVGLIPTGPELVAPGQAREAGDIPEYNSAVLSAYIRDWGGRPRVYDPVPDDPDLLGQSLGRALSECDLVCLLAGSSAGRDDWASTVIASLGKVLVHGVATRPGKPVILAVCSGKPVIGLPGYPVSAATAADLFLRPLLARFNGQPQASAPSVTCRFGRRMESASGIDEYVQVRVGPVGDGLVALPLSRGAGVVSALSKADGRIVIPRGETGLEAGQPVSVELYRDIAGVSRQILLAGSHDLTLDVLNDRLKRKHPPVTLASAPLGSLGGLLAIKRGEALVAGSHLLDAESGEYNRPYCLRYLPDVPLIGLALVERQQGLMVRKGNPLELRGLRDLKRPDVRFINRQRGSGTRVLLDWLLAKEGIDPGTISGYDIEEYTHLSVGAAVASGAADAALGIYSAAIALGLDFLPIGIEQYDLVIPAQYWDHELVTALREVVSDPDFQAAVRALGGYSTDLTGRVRWRT